METKFIESGNAHPKIEAGISQSGNLCLWQGNSYIVISGAAFAEIASLFLKGNAPQGKDTTMDITRYQKRLRQLFPTAVIEVEMGDKSIKWELKFHPSLSEKDHDESFTQIKEIFGDTLMERCTEETGKHFYIYQRYNSPSERK